MGLEPTASTLRVRRATHCATPPLVIVVVVLTIDIIISSSSSSSRSNTYPFYHDMASIPYHSICVFMYATSKLHSVDISITTNLFSPIVRAIYLCNCKLSLPYDLDLIATPSLDSPFTQPCAFLLCASFFPLGNFINDFPICFAPIALDSSVISFAA